MALVFILWNSIAVSSATRPVDEAVGVAGELRGLEAEYERLERSFDEACEKATSVHEFDRLQARFAEQRHGLAARFLKLAEDNPKDVAGLDALVWLLANDGSSRPAERAADLLLAHHAASAKTVDVARSSIARIPCPAAEKLLRGLAERAEDPAMQRRVQTCLAALLAKKADYARTLKSEGPDGRQRRNLDPAVVDYVLDANPARWTEEAARILARLVQTAEAGQARNARTTEFAKQLQFEIQHLARIAHRPISGCPV
jgi:hypothetical protein